MKKTFIALVIAASLSGCAGSPLVMTPAGVVSIPHPDGSLMISCSVPAKPADGSLGTIDEKLVEVKGALDICKKRHDQLIEFVKGLG